MANEMTDEMNQDQDPATPHPVVAVVMGSSSDYEKVRPCVDILEHFDIPCTVRVVSAHRSPAQMLTFGERAASQGIKVIIAAAGGAAHLPGMLAAVTTLPVIGIPVAGQPPESTASLGGLDALLSIVQMPAGIPVASMAINGSVNAGVLTARILALSDPGLRVRLEEYQRSLLAKAEAGDADVVRLTS
jgi:phosphoribosylaminoimidazole carboxylase PurE protein